MAFMGSQLQQQQALNWAPSVNGPPFGIPGARHEINVRSDILGRGPCLLHAGDHNQNQLMKYVQRRGFYDATTHHNNYNYNNLEYNILHGKEYLPRNPISRENYSFTSENSLSADQQLYILKQQLTLQDIIANIVSLAKNQVWSSVMMLKLEDGMSRDDIEMILLRVIKCWDDLLRNQFGYQFVLKLFTVCNEDQRTRFIMALTEFPFLLISLCLNSSGTKAIQKLLEKLDTPQQISLVVVSLIPGAFALATDSNGQHIIHFCVKIFHGDYTKYLVNEISEHCFRIGTNKSGCCVIQTCLDNSHGETRELLIREIIENAVHLSEDPYGNYVVQHLIGLNMQEVTKDLLWQFKDCIAALACNKYASNVVEKMLQSGEQNCAATIAELLSSPDASMLLVDPFGNFVIQTALTESKGNVHDSLRNFIQVNVQSMESNLYGKKILAWFEKKKSQYGQN